MRERFLLHALPILILCCLLLVPHAASAELLAGVHLGYGRTNYSQVLGHKNITNSEWSSGLWASYDQEDLLFTGVYQASLGLQDFAASRHLAHVGVSYRFLEEDLLTVYGGLGYQLVSTRLETPQVDAGQLHSFTGHGFAGQVVVDIAITEDFRTTALVAANPWTSWSHTSNKVTDANIDSGNAFIYRLGLNYDFSEDLGAQLSVLGNTYSIPTFSRNDLPLEETRSSSVSVNLGVTRRF
jgi:hypothetical protein